MVSGAVGELFPDDIWVEGEISTLKRARSGHVYFDLIEPAKPGEVATAKIPVVLFSQTKQIVNNQLKRQNVGRLVDGMAVRVRAAVDFYEVQGQLQLRMTGIDPRYILASMVAEREALLARLLSEGLTERNKFTTVPLVPLRIGLVTSRGSAAEADFVEELRSSGFGFQVQACDARVQGDLAPLALVAGIQSVCRHDVDVVVLIRGGGSRGDLAVFDNEQLARCIADSPVPVITGIGHEIDTSVADAVAHTSLKTPTAVAAELCARVGEYLDRVDGKWELIRALAVGYPDLAERKLGVLAKRAALAGRDGTSLANVRLDGQARRLAQTSRSRLAEAGRDLDHRADQYPRLALRRLRSTEAELGHIDARVRSSDPAVLLGRGWSVTRTTDGQVVRSVAEASPGDTLITEVLDGTIISNVSVVDNQRPENK